MADFSKTPGSRKNAVRQIKGPGMNKGLPKRHKQAKPKPFSDPAKRYEKTFGAAGGKGPSGTKTSDTSSNVPSTSGKLDPRRRDAGKGRFSQKFKKGAF
jgi:hypothetical protein